MPGIDFEPDSPTQRLSDIHIRNCTMSGNLGQGVSLTLPHLNGSSFPVSVTIDDCVFEANTWGYRLLAGGNQSGGVGPPPAGSIKLLNSRIHGSRLAALEIGGVTTSSASVRIANVSIAGTPALRRSSGAAVSPECAEWNRDWCDLDGECEWSAASSRCVAKKDAHANTSAIVVYSVGGVAATEPRPSRPHALELGLDLHADGAVGPELWRAGQALMGVNIRGSPNWAPVRGIVRVHTSAKDCAHAVRGDAGQLEVACVGSFGANATRL